jgi:beta-galactosidase
VDWRQFRIQLQTDQLAWVRDQVRLYDSKHPTHANPSALAENMPAGGADLWSEKQVLDFAGASMHMSWQFGAYRAEDIDLGIAFISDLLRSGSGGAPWWITEQQAGLSLSGRQFNPAADELTRWLWDDVGAGAKGVIFWCWNPRRFGREGGEWGLVNADGSPTSRSEAVSRFTQALAGPGKFLNRAEPLPARAAILYNRENLVLGSIDHSDDRVMRSLLGCHRALCERQIPVNFINEDDLKRGGAGRYAVLYLPYSYVMDNDCVAALRQYVNNGGTAWADGPVAWKDEYGGVRPEIPGGLMDVFGVKVEDIMPAGAFALTPLDRQAGDEMRLPLTLCGAEVVAKDAQGRPVATRNHYGKGTACYFGTALTLGYHRHPDPQAGDWIADPARPAALGMSVSATTDARRVFCHSLKCPEGLAAILTNPGPPCRVHVVFRGTVRGLKEVLTDQALEAKKSGGASEIEVTVPAGGVSIVLAQTEDKARAGEAAIPPR